MTHNNQLYPVFFRLDNLNTLIVGGGEVGLEKVSSILKSSPNAKVTLVAPEIKEEILKLSAKANFTFHYKEFSENDLENIQIVIVATANHELNLKVHAIAKKNGCIVNVADTPALCDFYMCSIVTKGDLKIGISTNGKSPTFAKRFREFLETLLPDSIQGILEKLNSLRTDMKGDFESKVKKLDEITEVMKADKKEN